MKTIIVDDERWMLMRFRAESANVEEIELIGCFENPQKALDFAMENPVELACLDIEMPKLDGIALAKKLREHSPGIRIVLISAYDAATVRAMAGTMEYGYLTKPYDAGALRSAIPMP